VFDGFQGQLAANRAEFYYDVAAGPFYGYNRPGAKPSQGVIWNWWRQGMMGGTTAHYDGIVAFSQTVCVSAGIQNLAAYRWGTCRVGSPKRDF
jgi:non-heme chloroperoxidase